MKKIVDRAREITRTVAGGIRRAVDPPLDDDATPLDIRHAIVEGIERRVQAAGRGRRILPDGAVRAKIFAPDAAALRALQQVLADVQEAAEERLREIRCEVPPGFRIDVGFVKARPASWSDGERLRLEFVAAAAPEPRVMASAPPPLLRLTVVRGTAVRTSYSFSDAVVRIGRSEAPVDDRGRVRRNDVAFLENGDEWNRTVTRGHCEIRFIRGTGEYRVFDERSANGTRILRRGEVIEVPARDPVGVALASGDELQLGRAALRVTIAP